MSGKREMPLAEVAKEQGDEGDVDHRTIVGRKRRAQMETRIIRSAVQVFAEQGIDAPVIDDFIKAAGIARGTFYNYFKSTEELLRATSDLLSGELISQIDKEIRGIKDPGLRFGMGIRLWMRWAEANPQWCRFVARAWNSVKYERPFQDIRECIRRKVIVVPDAYVAWDVLSGAIRQAMYRIGEGGVRRNYGSAVIEMCLQALGMSGEKKKEILNVVLPEVAVR